MTEPAKPPMPTAAAKDQRLAHADRGFTDPGGIVTDPLLSAQEKRRALDALEQDARQLAVATAEGMSGGEETRLRAVLEAKRTPEGRSPEAAFTDILKTLEDKLHSTDAMDVQFAITKAIDAVSSAREAIVQHESLPEPPPGAAEPGSRQELQEEIDKEQLDPGGSVRS